MENEDEYLTEFEEKVIEALQSSATVSWTYVDDEVNYGRFLSLLKQIMPPTCTANERAFLDEMREKGVYESEHEIGRDDHIDGEGICPAFISIGEESTVLFQSDFTKCNLKELVNE